MFGFARARVVLVSPRGPRVARHAIAVLIGVCLFAAGPSSAAAQDAPPGEAQPAKPAMTPPKLKQFAPAVYPPEAAAAGLSATVELELVINADGTVKEARVVAPMGYGFDEAALAAARQFVFEPATKDGQPMAARVRYPFVFELKVEEPPPPEPEAPPPPGRLEGQILDQDDNDPIPSASVIVQGPAGTEPLKAVTDAEGRFVFDNLAPGEYAVHVESEGMMPSDEQEQVVSGEATTITYRLQEVPDAEAFSAVARIPPPPREVTRRTIGKEQLTRIPGTRGDALRTVELMPGVARPPLGSGQLIVRGSAPADSVYLLEGLPVPLLYHFAGVTSFINSRLLEDIDFIPGNFSVRVGRKRAGVIEIGIADIPNEFKAVADVNIVDASLRLQAPLGEDAEIAIAARRSYIDILLGEAIGDDADIAVTAAPVYYDYQMIAAWRPSSKDKLRLMVYGSSDELALLFQEPSDMDAAVSGDFDVGTQFHRAHASWRRKLSDTVDQDIDIAVGTLDFDFGVGEAFDFNLSGTDMYGRAEWRARASDYVTLVGGLDVVVIPGRFTYIGPPPASAENNPDAMNPNAASLSNRDQITVINDYTVNQPAVYFESQLNLAPLRIVLGTRLDYYDEIEEFSFDPRLSSSLQITDTTKLKGGVGLFSQPPEFYESSIGLGNPNLEPTQTLHVGAGIEQDLWEGWDVDVEGFYKHLYDRVIGTPFGLAPYFINGGEGRVFGLEVAAKANPPMARYFGYLSYTLMRSERKQPGGDWELFDYDQTHILTFAAVVRLGAGWEAGTTFRLVSGNLDTPVIGSNLNVVTGNYTALFGPVNSERNSLFHRLDVRVQKKWTWPSWSLALYLDVLNIYNERPVEGTQCDFEYRECEDILGLPIIPNLGLRGEI